MGNCGSETEGRSKKASFISTPTTQNSKITMHKRQSRVCVEEDQHEDLKDIFTVSSCPVENLSITDKVYDLEKKDKQIRTKFHEAKWKKITYTDGNHEGYNFWGLCKWIYEDDKTLEGKAFLYKANKTQGILIGGIFKSGSLVLHEKHYKFLDNGSYYYGKLN